MFLFKASSDILNLDIFYNIYLNNCEIKLAYEYILLTFVSRLRISGLAISHKDTSRDGAVGSSSGS